MEETARSGTIDEEIAAVEQEIAALEAEKGRARATCDNVSARTIKEPITDFSMNTLNDYEEKEPERMADSSDVWDIARSVIMLGETEQQGVRYISQEKCNYGPLQKTILFSLDDGALVFKGYTTKRDKEFVQSNDYNARTKPAVESAEEFLLEYLEDGEKEAEDLKEAAKANGISERTLERVRSQLKKSGQIATYRKPGGSKWYWFKK